MTDPENPEIEALLRASRAREPMPEHVATRLDDVIAGLAAERAAQQAPNVVPLRRRVPRLAAAAAAFVLLAGGAAVASGILHQANTGASESAKAPRAVTRDGSPLTPSAGAGGEKSGTDRSLQGLTDGIQAPTLRRTHLREDVLALLGGRTAARSNGYDSAKQPAPVAGCRTPARTPAGALVRSVTLDGVPAVLVVPQQKGPAVVARVYSCGGSNVLARTTLASQ